MFFQRKAFGKRKPQKNSLVFRKRNFYSKPYKYLVFKTSDVIAIVKLSKKSMQNVLMLISEFV